MTLLYLPSPIQYADKSHINIHRRSNSFLGRYLHNSTRFQLITPEGVFQSVSGYWYYLTTKEKDAKLFEVHGWETSLLEANLTKLPKKLCLEKEVFQSKIKKALDAKIKWSEYWMEEFTESTLPFLYYHLDADGNVVDESRKYRWLLNHLEARRTLLQQRRDDAT